MVDLKALLNHPAQQSGSGILACATTGVDQAVRMLNGDVEKLFASAEIPYDSLHDPHTPISLNAFCQLYTNVADELKQPDFGLLVGANYKPVDLGVLGYLAANAPNLATSLQCLTQYFDVLQQGTRFRLNKYRGKTALEYEIIDPQVRNRTQDAELSLAMFFNFIQLYIEDQQCVEEVQFQHAQMNEYTRYEHSFGASALFNADTNRIVLDNTRLHQTSTHSDNNLFTTLHSLFQTSRPLTTTNNPLHAIRTTILQHLEHAPLNLNTLATQLAIPSWTLRRQLAAQGYNFTNLVDEVRQQQAQQLLRRGNHSITRIAMMLGYSEVSAFSRAFRRWVGVSPACYCSQSAGHKTDGRKARAVSSTGPFHN